jgi:benzodiazapine receptor
MLYSLPLSLAFVCLLIISAIVYGKHNGHWKEAFNFEGPWYQLLKKPKNQPPKWVFKVVWPILYTTMVFVCFKLYDMYNHPTTPYAHKVISDAIVLFWVQLAFNMIWTPIFVGLRSYGIALINVIVLDILVLLLLIKLSILSTVLAAVLVPYFVWLLVATYLNLEIWILN